MIEELDADLNQTQINIFDKIGETIDNLPLTFDKTLKHHPFKIADFKSLDQVIDSINNDKMQLREMIYGLEAQDDAKKLKYKFGSAVGSTYSYVTIFMVDNEGAVASESLAFSPVFKGSKEEIAEVKEFMINHGAKKEFNELLDEGYIIKK